MSAPGHPPCRALAVASILSSLLLWPGLARAQPAPEAPKSTSEPSPKPPDSPQAQQESAKTAPPKQKPLPPGQQRPVPDYDGRGEEPTTAGDVLIWVPRVALSPLYLVSEFVVRRPLGWVTTMAEKEELPALLVDFFTFGPDRYAGIIPTGIVDFGFRPSIGVYFFYNDFLVEDNFLRVRAAWGGPDWRQLLIGERIEFNSDHELLFRFEYLQRPDWVFHGFGPDSPDSLESRFLRREITTRAEYSAKTWRSSSLHAQIGVRDARYDLGDGCCDDPSVQSRVDGGAYPEPPGGADGFFVLSSGLEAVLDTREPRHQEDLPDGSDFVQPPGTGVRLALRGKHHLGLDERAPFAGAAPDTYHWVNYGATLGGYVDLTGQQRTVGLSLIADFADPIKADGEIPFDEQVSLGGGRPLHGFLDGRFRDRSAVAAVVDYHWPIWVWLDGVMHYGMGNVFGAHLEGFDFDKLRSSFGIGFSANTARDHVFQLLLGFGTETVEDGMAIEDVRFMLGATHGF